MEIFEKLKAVIEKSPLGFIKGSCRFLNLDLDEWVDWKEEDFEEGYSDEQRTITLAIGEEFLGTIVVDKEHIENIWINEYNDFLMALVVRKDDLVMHIFLSCKHGFPGLREYGEFLADLSKKPIAD